MIKNCRTKWQLFKNKICLSIKIKNKFPFIKIKINEKHKNIVKLFRYLLTILSYITALNIFKDIITSLIISFCIHILTRIFEKVVFFYTSMYIHLFPSFTIEHDQWIGTGFGYAVDSDIKILIMQLVFKNPSYTKNIHGLVKQWLSTDQDNFNISIILDNENNKYYIVCYPNPAKSDCKKFFHEAKKVKYRNKDQELLQLHILPFFYKDFMFSELSCLPIFTKNYKNGDEFILIFSSKNEDASLEPIILNKCKIKQYHVA